MAFPKNAEKHNNNVAFPKGRLWRAHCVLFFEPLTQGVSQRDAERTPCVLSYGFSAILTKIKTARFSLLFL